MATFSDYRREESHRIEAGNYRVKIVAAVEAVSKSSGLPMIVVTVSPDGSDIQIKNYIVQNEHFNKNATQFFDSFNIPEGDFNLLGWIGATGAAKLAEDDNGYLKIKWWIDKEKADKLPPWSGEVPQRVTVSSDFEEIATDDDLPF